MSSPEYPPPPPVYVPPRAGGAAATWALILGIVGLLGIFTGCCCCFTFPLQICSPIAWLIGHQELKAIREGRSPASGEGTAKAGMIMGMVGTAVIVLQVIIMIVWVALAGASAVFDTLKKGPHNLPFPK